MHTTSSEDIKIDRKILTGKYGQEKEKLRWE